ncbi:MAG: Hsp20/alpha crystallin family protein [Planctomycetota bacterium]|nr:Hsp20/alpha crystallin family protein [Planctomycetota bacterium]
MNGLFGDFLRPDATLGLFDQNWTPPLDVAETETAVVVKVELPGLEASDLDISIKDDVLTIQGEKKSEKEEKGRNFHRMERSYGSFSRSVALPSEVDGEKVKATYTNGVLEVHLEKKEETRKREIKVELE